MNKEDYGKYYIQGLEHYLIPKDAFLELFDELVNWKNESTNLKQALKEIREYIEGEESYYFNNCTYSFVDDEWSIMSIPFNNILQIIDKVLGSDNNGNR